MNRLVYDGVSEAAAARIYGAWLLGAAPAEGAAIACGPVLLLTDGAPALSARAVEGEADVRTALEDDLRTAGALRNAREWRRLPVGTAVSSSAEGLLIFPAERFALPPAARALAFPHALEDVLTEKEAADRFSVPAKTVRARCGEGALGAGAKHTPAGWLLDRQAAARCFGGDSGDGGGTEALSPLLIVFATAEAAELWGRTAEEVRSAAAGAGHRAARLGDGARRRAGRTWLVTRAAMETLYGDPRPDRWRAFAERMRG